MTPNPRSPTKLDLYLAGFLTNSRHGDARLRRAGISFATARAIVDQVNTTAFGDLFNRNRQDMVVATFGPPDHDESDRMVYESVLWPEHVYEYGVESGSIVKQGFVAKTPRPVPGDLARDVEPLRHSLQIDYDTADDMRQWLGSPDVDDGWWPYSWFRYAVPGSGDRLVELNFEHRVLVNIGLGSPGIP